MEAVFFSILLSFLGTPPVRVAEPAAAKVRPARAKPTPAPAVPAQIAPPDVDFTVTPAVDKTERHNGVSVFASISNKSDTTITLTRLRVYTDQAPEPADAPEFQPGPLDPFAGVQYKIGLNELTQAVYGQHRVLVVVEYAWSAGGRSFVSTRTAPVSVEVTRKFEEEAKGFPGGTAAFLYLLLPVIPFFLSFQLSETLRTTKRLAVPVFKSEYVVPAFFAAVVVNIAMVWTTKQDTGLDYSSARVFLTTLGVSLLAGAAIPSVCWLRGFIQAVKWDFKQRDPWPEYARKALLGPRAPIEFEWVKAEVNGEQWEGILLQQPGGEKVLGAALQVSVTRPGQDPAQAYDIVKEALFDGDGKLKDASLLVQKLRQGELTASPFKNVKRGGSQLSGICSVAISGEISVTDPRPEQFVQLVI